MKAIFLTIFALTVVSTVIAQQDRKIDERHTAEFRYGILSNEVIGGDSPYRSVSVLLDEAAFSEQTLKKLFYLVSTRFPKPKTLEVWVSTSLWDIPTPEEADGGSISERGYDPHDDLHPNALMMRQSGNELFRYTSDSKPPYINMKTVILKGKDPQAPVKR